MKLVDDFRGDGSKAFGVSGDVPPVWHHHHAAHELIQLAAPNALQQPSRRLKGALLALSELILSELTLSDAASANAISTDTTFTVARVPLRILLGVGFLAARGVGDEQEHRVSELLLVVPG